MDALATWLPVCPAPRVVRLPSPGLLLLLMGIALSTGGCPKPPDGLSTMPVLATDDPQAESDMRAAHEAEEAGRLDEAGERYERFLAEHPNDPLTPVAELGLGRLALHRGDAERARARFEALVDHADASVADRARFHLGLALHHGGHHGQALTILEPFLGEVVDPEDTSLLLQTMAAAAMGAGDLARAVEAYDRLAEATVPETDRQAAHERLGTLITESATPDDIRRLFEQLPRDGVAWPLVAARSAHQAHAAGDTARVREVLAALRSRDVPLGEELERIAMRLERRDEADPRVIGAILPLSGRAREVGQLALRGLLLAAGEGGHPGDAPEVVFRDDAGDPQQAAQAVDDLVTSRQPIAIIGPIGSEAATAAARRAQELGIPMLTLAPAPSVTDAGPFVFRLFFTPEDEARALVEAARRRGARRFAIVHPDTSFGRTFRDAFERQVRSQGGDLVTAATYPRGTTSFAKPLRDLTRSRIDALLIADGAPAVQLIAPALAAAGLWSRPAGQAAPDRGRAITVLVPSVGFNAELVRASGSYLQGALFSRPFDVDARGSTQFAARFQARFGTDPDVFAAYAYDALQLVRSATEAGAETRQDLADALSTRGPRRTVGGSGGLGPERVASQGTRIRELHRSALVPPSTAPDAQ
jgi:branched-chain amino acid transport system substrate-binding protein